MLTQAREEKLVGGGDITVLPDGIDLEVLKTGGLGGMFFSVPNARFVYRQVLASPRHAAHGVGGGAAARQQAAVPHDARPATRSRCAPPASSPMPHAPWAPLPMLAAGTWANDAADDRWATPTLAELRHDIDHFHLPPATVASSRESWGEWHYFNVLSDDASAVGVHLVHRGWRRARRRVGRAAARHACTTSGSPARRFSPRVPGGRRALLHDRRRPAARHGVGDRAAGRQLPAARRGAGGGRAARRWRSTSRSRRSRTRSSRARRSTAGRSSRAMPCRALRALATRHALHRRRCGARLRAHSTTARAYHDHNWGVWRGVTWEWGAARAGTVALLYGRVQPPDSLESDAPLFVYVTDSLGFVSLFRPRAVAYEDGRTITVDGRRVARAVARRHGGRARRRLAARGAARGRRRGDRHARRPDGPRRIGCGARALRAPTSCRCRGACGSRMRVRGVRYEAEGTGFFETYR